MKNLFSFLSLALVLLLIFACDLRVPKAIQIKGSPDLKLAIKEWSFPDPFEDIMDNVFDSDGNDDIEIFECINAPKYRTFLVRMELFGETIELEDPSNGGTTINIDGTEYEITGDLDGDTVKLTKKVELTSSDEPINLPFSGFTDSMYGFKLKEAGIKSKLYIYGSEIVTAIKIKLTGDISIHPQKVTKNIGLKDNAHTTITALPDGGIDIELAHLLNSDDDVEIDYEVYLDENEEIKTEWLGTEHDFKGELVIWIPMELEAGNDGATINLSSLGSFDGFSDFFTSLSGYDYIKSIIFSMGMSENPFQEGKIIIQDKNHRIENPMSANALNFALSEDDVKYINNNPFKPELSIYFEPKAVLGIPKDFNFGIVYVSLKAELEYTIDL